MDKGKEIKKIIKSRELKKSIKQVEQQKDFLGLNEEQLKDRIIEGFKQKASNYTTLLSEISQDKSLNEEQKKKKKKYFKEKIRKARKTLSTNDDLTYLVREKKRAQRKLKTQEKKVSELVVKEKKKNLICFRCRKKGHLISDCKEENDTAVKCFNCGARDHSVHGCSLPVDYGNLPFAHCFICKENGHLSSRCQQSDKGIYINGGFCYICKSNEHLAKECTEKRLDFNAPEEEKPRVKIFKNARRVPK
mmetsp:Transcript_5143/g.5281  ORF Transcript_5143/g.5281 Transcript_5143/m.5281 type:complete len:248 (-) Transcript_5143:68-811(-)